MISRYSLISFLLLVSFSATAQIRYSGKAEVGYLKFQYIAVQVDPGPAWQGYYLEQEPNGVDINIVNGVRYGDHFKAGVGTGYLNFGGIHGLAAFADFTYLPLKTRLTPLLNVRFGYSHLWNQYEKGTGTASAEVGIGVNYRLTDRHDIYLQAGYLGLQQSLLVPFRLGWSF